MKIPKEDVPQADKLDIVLDVVEAVDNGRTTFQQMASVIGKVDRQGRYYRRAAEILGFIRNTANHSQLTQLGREYLDGTGVEQKELLARAILSSRTMLRVVPFLEGHPNGVTRTELENFLLAVTGTTQSMVHRRTSTIVAWLGAIGVIEARGKKGPNQKIFLTSLPNNVELLEYDADDEPMFPRSYALKEYEEVSKKIRQRTGKIERFVDEAKMERANHIHQHLVNLMAERIKAANSVPKQNRLIDLSAEIQKEIFLFEMKSTTVDNVRDQVRKAVSQLYEYRYLQDVTANLVIVLDECPKGEEGWIIDYLREDRNIMLVWDGNDKFDCPEPLKKRLPFIYD